NFVLNNFDENDVLQVVGSAGNQSEHPLAQAIVAGVKEQHISLLQPEAFEALPGYVIRAENDNKEVFAGTRKLVNEQNITDESETEEIMEKLEYDGKTAMLIAINHKLAGVVAGADTVKETSKEAIARMHELGLEVIMLTGDNERTANAIAKEVGVDVVVAEVLPDQKSDKINELQSQGKKVAMVGDGINDAPSLAVAD